MTASTGRFVSDHLHQAIGRGGFFTLAFGAIVGSGWVIGVGEWLKAAGPGGSVIGLLAGGGVTVLVALCYGELASRFSSAGGEFLYTLETFGRMPAFLVGWFLTVYQVSVCGFEAIALAWMLRTLLPQIAMPVAYSIAGLPVTWDALLIGVTTAVVVGVVHCRGAASAIRFQNWVTYGFLVASVLLVCIGLSMGSAKNLRPLFPVSTEHSWISGALWTFATCAFFMNGWQASLHAIEERRAKVSARSVVLWMAAAIGAAALFYACIVVSSAMALPWPTLTTRELPAAAAFRSLGLGGALGSLVLVAAVISLGKTWNATVWIATRLLFAQGRTGVLPAWLAHVHQRSGSPRNAVMLVTVLTALQVFLGKGAILPIVDMLSLCSAVCIILCLLALLRVRVMDPRRPAFSVPGGRLTICCALLGAALMVGVALLAPMINGKGKSPVEWTLLGGWALLGALIWIGMARHTRVSKAPAGGEGVVR